VSSRVSRASRSLSHQVGGAGEEHAAFLFGRFHAERDRQVRLAGPDRTGQDQILGRCDPFAPCERVDLHRGDAVCRRKIKGVECLHLGEACLPQALAHDGLMPRRFLGPEHFMQIVFVGPVAVAGLPRQTFKRAGDPRQLERPPVRGDEVADQRGGADAGVRASRSGVPVARAAVRAGTTTAAPWVSSWPRIFAKRRAASRGSCAARK